MLAVPLVVASLLALFAEPLAGQAPTVLRGEVRDSAGQPVADVEVALRDSARAVAGTTTDAAGRYLLMALPSGGPFTLEFSRLGFAATTRSDLYLAAGESRRLDVVLSLRPMGLERILVVTAPDLVFSGTRTGAATVVEERAVETLPNVDRGITSLAALSPMVSIDGDAISVGGQNSRFNSLRVDGALAQDVFGLSPSGVPGGQANARALPLAAIRQYSVLTAPFDVRQSGFTGGILNATTRSGGERWQASGFGYYRDGAFSGIADDSDAVRSQGRGLAEAFRAEAAGFTLGGPVGPTRLFVAGEYERRRRPIPGFNLGSGDTLRVRLVEDSVARLAGILREQYGIEAGEAGDYTLDNPLGNVFARLDVPVGGRHDLMLSYNFISAVEDLPPGRLAFDAYQLGSSATRLESATHAGVGRLVSRISRRTSNELLVNIQRTADATRAASADPQVEVRVTGAPGRPAMTRLVQAGGDPLAHDAALDQGITQVIDNLSHTVGDHLLTFGVEGTVFAIGRRFLPASRGVWRFDSMDDLAANQPTSYERLVLEPGADPEVGFQLFQAGGYVQDEWSIGDRLELRLGLRVDLPVTLSWPGYNHEADVLAEVVTDRLPSGNPLVSPRVGFNWASAGSRRTQVRGGVGVFSGVPPLAWIADAYANTGLRTRLVLCDGAGVPSLAPDEPPEACVAGGTETVDLVVFDDEFRYPQDLRGSLAVDRELPFGFLGTLEGVYTRALHQVALEDINLEPAVGGPYPVEEGYPEVIGTRPIYGDPLLIATRFGPLAPIRRWEDLGRVLRVSNRSRNAAVALAAELQRRFTDRLDLRLSYTYTRAIDNRSLLYESAALNYGMTPIRWNPNRPDASLSAFARPHRVLASAWARLAPWGDGLDATLLYVGQSGLPYSYVYASDMNGDGYPGPGVAAQAYNDLIFAPAGLADVPAAGIVQRFLMFELAALDPCLREAAGTVIGRNTCRTPWSNRLDLRFSQGVSLPFGRVRITGDIMNVLNLIDASRGLVYTAPPAVPLLHVRGRSGCPGRDCSLERELLVDYVGPRRRNEETGLPTAELPWIVSLPESQWRAQVGVRVEF